MLKPVPDAHFSYDGRIRELNADEANLVTLRIQKETAVNQQQMLINMGQRIDTSQKDQSVGLSTPIILVHQEPEPTTSASASSVKR